MLTHFKRLIIVTLALFTSHLYADTNTNLLLRNSSDPIAGNPNGKVSIVEFFDYQCSHCMSMAPVIANIIQHNPNVRIVFKDFPIRGPLSETAARAALAANKQGKYFALNHALLTTQLFLSDETIMKLAQQAGLNIEQLKKEMNSDQISNEINTTYALAKALRIDATPAFFIGPTSATDMNQLHYTLGEMSEQELQQAIDGITG